jgi:hypothetical protein
MVSKHLLFEHYGRNTRDRAVDPWRGVPTTRFVWGVAVTAEGIITGKVALVDQNKIGLGLQLITEGQVHLTPYGRPSRAGGTIGSAQP